MHNIVAACWFCNISRHRAKQPLSPYLYGKKVRARLAKGKWHGFVARNELREVVSTERANCPAPV